MLTLSLLHNHLVPVEAECISPNTLAGLAVCEIERLSVFHGNRKESLADHFSVEGSASDESIVVKGDCSRIKWLGASMSRGTLRVDGSVGMHIGSRMSGGEISVSGDAGDWAGAEMTGGMLKVHGNVGNCAGAGYCGSVHGMKGGTIIIDGDAGHETGAYLRRGLIVVQKSVGDFCGFNALAGTVIAGGRLGLRPGAGMKRASIVACGPAPELLPTFQWSGVVAPQYLRMIGCHLRTIGVDGLGQILFRRFVRYCGDMVALGKGEILTLAP